MATPGNEFCDDMAVLEEVLKMEEFQLISERTKSVVENVNHLLRARGQQLLSYKRVVSVLSVLLFMSCLRHLQKKDSA